ncbi:Alpha-1,2-fucosyltransferase [uncultured Candidatus Thioglobus sp.]|nr:Alpha-1,2-fucosyltransferase [uncultured Candidatus Thioglobus sp.]
MFNKKIKRKITTVNIIGGLGNQMFQYAFGYSVSKNNNTALKLDTGGFNDYHLRGYGLDIYGIKINANLRSKHNFYINKPNIKNKTLLEMVIYKFFKELLKVSKSVYPEKKDFAFDKDVFNIKKDTYFYGYWQNEKYFKKYRNDILKIFTLKNLHTQTQAYQKQISDSSSVSLHIRRGDYVTDKHTNSIMGICNIDYYKKAVFLFQNAHFFIFSDDLDWAKNNLDFIENKTFVELDKDIPVHESMYLMSQCEHNIIANSSFSWWGAWLNQSDNKTVVAPKKWFTDKKLQEQSRDVYCENWERI